MVTALLIAGWACTPGEALSWRLFAGRYGVVAA